MVRLTFTRSQVDRIALEFFATVLFFLFIYAPDFVYFPFNVTYFIVLLAGSYFFYGQNFQRLLDFLGKKSLFTFILFYLFSTLYLIVVPLISEWPFDATFLMTNIRLLIDILVVIPFFVLLFSYDLDYKMIDVLKLLVKIGVAQGVFAVLMFVIPGMRDFVFNYLIKMPSEKLIDQPYRGYGLSGDFYFSSPLFQALVFVVNTVLYLMHSKKRYLLYFPFILLSMILNARVSVVVIPVFFAVIFVATFYFDNLRWLRKFSGLSLFFIMAGSLVVVYFMLNPEKAQSLIWVMEGIIGGISAMSGNLTDSKTFSIILQGHLHLPTRPFHVWFGEGLVVFGNLNSPVRSDLGYIRYIYYGGIVLSLLFYFTIISFVLNRIINTAEPLLKILLLTLLVTTFVVHFKGDIFNSSAFLKGFLVLTMFTLLEKNNRRQYA